MIDMNIIFKRTVSMALCISLLLTLMPQMNLRAYAQELLENVTAEALQEVSEEPALVSGEESEEEPMQKCEDTMEETPEEPEAAPADEPEDEPEGVSLGSEDPMENFTEDVGESQSPYACWTMEEVLDEYRRLLSTGDVDAQESFLTLLSPAQREYLTAVSVTPQATQEVDFCGENLTWKLEDGVLTISGTGDMWDFSANGAPWYSARASITKLVIDAEVTSIGSYAFYYCTELTGDLSIPENIVSIGDYAFAYARNLTSVTMSNATEYVGYHAFASCSKLERAVIPACVISGEEYASGGNYAIFRNVFYSDAYDNGVKMEVEIALGAEKIGKSAFEGAFRVERVVIPESVTVIENRAFYNHSDLKTLELPGALTTIGDLAFFACTGLTGELTIPESVRSIGERAFESCTGVTSVTMSNALEYVGYRAFAYCSKLEKAFIPACIISGEEYPSGGNYATFTNIFNFGTDYNGAKMEVEIAPGTEKIGKSAFDGSFKVDCVTIPESVTRIDERAFYGCASLKTLELPENLTTIGNFAFYNCTGLTGSLIIPERVNSIGNNAFYSCAGFSGDLRIPDSVVSIGNRAFSYCNGLTSVTITDATEYVGAGAFASCNGLQRAVIPACVISGEKYPSGDYATFGNIFNLERSCTVQEVKIAPGTEKIGMNAFKECRSIQRIYVPGSVTSVDSTAFASTSSDLEFYVIAGSWFEEYAELQGLQVGGHDLEKVISLTVSFPDAQDFSGCRLLLIGGGKTAEIIINGQLEYLFDEAIPGERYYIQLQNTYGDTLYRSTSFVAEEQKTVAIPELRSFALSLRLRYPDGAVVSGGYQVLWYREDGSLIDSGMTIGCQPEGMKVIPVVELKNQLGTQYVRPAIDPLTAGSAPENTIVTLKPLEKKQVSGIVTDGRDPLPGVSVLTQQIVNGRFPVTDLVTTGSDGRYTLELYDTAVTLTLSAAGYEGREMEMPALPAEGVLEEITLKHVYNRQIVLQLTYADEDGGQSKSDSADLQFAVENADGQAITDFTFSGNILTFGAGVEKDTAIRLTVSDLSGKYRPVELMLPAAKTTARIDLVKYGCLQVKAPNQSARLLVYGQNGKRVVSASIKGSLTTAPLADGTYTVVLIRESGLFTCPARLDGFEQLGMKQGEDYALQTVSLRAGENTICTFEQLPELDLEQFYCTDPELTSFYLNANTVTTGKRFNLTASAPFKTEYAGRVTDVEWVISYPESFRYLPATLTVDSTVPERILMGEDSITVAVADPAQRLRLCLIPTVEGQQEVAASLRFKLDGRTVVQPVGVVSVRVKSMAISVSPMVSTPEITVSGNAPVGSQVLLYDNDMLTAQCAPDVAGQWQIPISLSSPNVNATHCIFAIIKTTDGYTLRSEQRQVQYYYSPDPIQVKTVTMQYGKNTFVMDYSDPDGSRLGSYSVTPGTSFYTFNIDFTGDTSRVQEVELDVFLSNGTKSTQKAAYVENVGWTVLFQSDHFAMPVNTGVRFKTDEDYYYSTQQMGEEAGKFDALIEAENELEKDAGETDGLTYIAPIDLSSYTGLDAAALAELAEYNQLVEKRNQILEELRAETAELEESVKAAEGLSKLLQDAFKELKFSENSMVIDNGFLRLETQLQPCPDINLSDPATAEWVRQEGLDVYFASDSGTSIILTKTDFDDKAGTMTMAYYAPVTPAPVARRVNQNAMINGIVIQSAEFALGAAALGNGNQNIYFTANAQTTGIGPDGRPTQYFQNNQSMLMQYIEDNGAQWVEFGASNGNYAVTAAVDAKLGELAEVQTAANNRIHYFEQKLDAGAFDNISKADEIRLLDAIDDTIAQHKASEKALNGLVKTTTVAKFLPALDIITGVPSFNSDAEEYCDLLGDDSEYASLQRKLYMANMVNTCAAMGVATVLVTEATVQTAGCVAALMGVPSILGAATLSAGAIAALGTAGLVLGVIGLVIGGVIWYNNVKHKEKTASFRGGEIDGQTAPKVMIPVVDPSGYIYEAVPSNRVEGATAVCEEMVTYYNMYDEPYQVAEEWDAQPYNQVNPQVTDTDGWYAWDVPDGRWRVRVEKEGFETLYTDWMDVPPPQLDVNLGIVSKEAPRIQSVIAHPDGVEVTFSRYLTVESANAEAVRLLIDGTVQDVQIELVDPEADPQNPDQEYVSKLRLLPSDPLASGTTLQVELTAAAVSYAGTAAKPDTAEVQVQAAIESFHVKADDFVIVGEVGALTVQAVPAEAAAGKRVSVHSTSGVYVRLPDEPVQLDSTGAAQIPVTGVLPGQDILTVSIDGTEYETTVDILILMEYPCDHVFGDWNPGGQNGHQRECTLCGRVFFESHIEGIAFENPAACCTEDGIRKTPCAVCGEIVHSQVLPAVGHSYVNYICTVCKGVSPNALTVFGVPRQLAGGSTFTVKASLPKNIKLPKKNLVWTLRDKDLPYASISSSGKLTTRTVYSPVNIEISVWPAADPTAVHVIPVELVPRASRVSITPSGNEKGIIALDLQETNSLQLSAATYPDAALDSGTWKTSSSTIAAVSAEGNVVFKKPGVVTVTFTAADGSKKSASVKVYAGKPVRTVTLTNSAGEAIDGPLELISGRKLTLKAMVNGDATVKKLSWTTSDPTAASVSASGVVTAKTVYEEKTLTVSAAATDGSGVIASVELTVRPKDTVLPISYGEKIVNSSTISADLADDELILGSLPGSTWSSSNKSIAEVNDGVVTFHKKGSVVITGKNGSASGKVTVKISTLVEGLEIVVKSGKTKLVSGKSKLSLAAIPTNIDATTKSVVWKTSNSKVAKVSSSGVVSAVAGVTVPTFATITATAKDGSGKSASIQVEVIPVSNVVRITAGEAFTTQNGIRLENGEALTNRTLKLDIDQQKTLFLNTVVYPLDASGAVVWKSSNTKIAAVQDGVVTIFGTGKVTITATTADGGKKTASIKLNVVCFANALVDKSAAHTVSVGKKLTLKVGIETITGLSPTEKVLKYRVDNTDYATISTTGVLTPKKNGKGHTVTVTVSYDANPNLFIQIPVTIR